MRFTDKCVVILGGNAGIGLAAAKMFAAEGAKLAITGRNRETLGLAAEDVGALGIVSDMGDVSPTRAAMAEIEHTLGGIDVLFVNAGVSLDQSPVESSDPQAFEETMRVNLFGAYHCARLAVPHMRARGGGRMVMTGSGMGHSSLHGHAAYSCSKAGLWMLVRILADELRADGIAVNELVPGPVRTAMTGVPQSSASVVNNPVEWLKQPQDVVPLAMFLATHPAPGPTGQSFSLMRRTF
jgi:3-oxoacyl-[acyl-carrier protein] reductase